MSSSAGTLDMNGSEMAPLPASMTPENTRLPSGSGRGLEAVLAIVGLAGLALTAAVAYLGVGGIGPRHFVHALASYHVGAMTCLALSLGGLFFVMLFQLMNAGWTGTVRKQFENLAAMVPVAVLLVLPVPILDYIKGGQLFAWMNAAAQGDVLLQHKAGYLNAPFFFIRLVFYALVWIGLSALMNDYSKRQDRTGDFGYTVKARFLAAPGMLIFALTVAFASFDLLKSLDYRFFSTMWGVYYFAGAAFSAVSLVTVILALLRLQGRLEGLVTHEHFHDLGKIMFSFTVFWAYIAFSQYFLIWYSNIPEETGYFLAREQGSWPRVGTLLILGHFVAPFLVLINRVTKRRERLLIAAGLWMVAMQVVDMLWVIRPMVYAGADPSKVPGPTAWWLDAAGILGALGIFGALLVRRVSANPLTALRDPRMGEALHHKNYV